MLQADLNSMADFYGKDAVLLKPAGPPPPAGFESYKKNAASGGVMSMLQQVFVFRWLQIKFANVSYTPAVGKLVCD